jgi:hypothetical protein
MAVDRGFFCSHESNCGDQIDHIERLMQIVSA